MKIFNDCLLLPRCIIVLNGPRFENLDLADLKTNWRDAQSDVRIRHTSCNRLHKKTNFISCSPAGHIGMGHRQVATGPAALRRRRRHSSSKQVFELSVPPLVERRGWGLEAEILALKHESQIFVLSSNPICGSWKCQAGSPWAQKHRV